MRARRGSPDPDETSDMRARRGSPDPDETDDTRARRGSPDPDETDDMRARRGSPDPDETSDRRSPPTTTFPSPPSILSRLDLSSLPEPEQIRKIESTCADAQRSLNLQSGPLFHAVYFHLGPDRQGRLLLVSHHLVVDAVSWRILLEDLHTAYKQLVRGESIALPFKTTSFQEWSLRLLQHAATRDLQNEVAHWLSATEGAGEPFPLCHSDGTNTVASSDTVSMTLDASNTAALLQQVPSAYHTRIDEVLLASFVLAYYRWSGSDRLFLDLESHGREDLFPEVDVSRTVGWFTSLFPLVLTMKPEWNLGTLLKSVKEQLRAVPHHGIGFGMLRYLGDDETRRQLAACPQPAMAFNYLGQVDRLSGTETAPFAVAAESTGPPRSPEAVRRHALEVNSGIADGKLRVEWTYSRSFQTKEKVQALATRFQESLVELIRHCLEPDSCGRTPSDFPHASIRPAQLDRLVSQNADLEDLYDASPTQEGLLFHSLAAQGSGIYVMQLSGRLRGHREADAFLGAWQTVLQRHPALRTSFWWKDAERPLQLVHRDLPLPLERLDWQGTLEKQQAERFETLLREDRRREFDLAHGPLVRLTWVQVASEEYRFLWTHHHLLLDGWSLPLVLQDLIASFEMIRHGRKIALNRTQPFREYVAWLRSQDNASAKAFWRKRLSGFTTPTALGVDRTASATVSTAGMDQRVARFSTSVTRSLESLARNNRLTLSTVLQGVWALLLSRYSGESEVLFGVTVSGRSAPLRGIESIVGMLINTLPARIAVPAGERWLPWLASLQDQQVELRQYEHSALSRIQEASDIRRGSPLFESLFVFENYPVDASLFGNLGERLPVSDLRFDEQTHYPLTLTVDPGPALQIKVGFDTRRFDASAIERLVAHLESIIDQIVADPNVRLGDICVLPPAERQQTRVEFNRTQSDYPHDQSLPGLVEAQVKRMPDAVAVTVGSQSYTYAELNRRSNQLARYLQQKGVRSGERVGICMTRSWDMMVALLGVLKAGGAYVPLDPSFPDERLRFMLEDARVLLLLTEIDLVQQCRDFAPTVTCLDTDGDILTHYDASDLSCQAKPQDLAYVIYTSGSTGYPKGVQIPHRALVNFLTSMQRQLGVDRTDKLLAVTTISFDIAALELYLPLLAGAHVVIASRQQASDGMQLLDLLVESGATMMQATPATWRMLLQAGWKGDPRLQILVGGEALDKTLARNLARRGRSLWNLYGPTETTIWSTATCLKPGLDHVTIGRPIANTQVYLLDAGMRMVPLGVAGELYIGGDGLARGYLNRPDLTATRFVPDPFGSRTGSRLYRTGDRCRWLPNGQLEFLGRCDNQVKVRGYRIELGEIEAVLSQHPGILEVAASVWPDDSGEHRLAAHLITQQDSNPTVSHLRSFLRSKLPDYMVPESYTFVDAFPRTTNGKLNRKALPEPGSARPVLEKPYVSPRTPLEASLAEIWAEVLGLEKVGVHDNFFDLGGASMKALRIVAKAQMAGLVIDPSLLKPELLFEHPTIAEWSTLFDEKNE
ncbi:MAG: amino acid adenylation domain-containing protein [Pirellulales bacterium]